ncbi:MAG: hypothetical protein VKL41_10310 [Snowella sp.]|nr:hypothetical protein [Snowella sp.]
MLDPVSLILAALAAGATAAAQDTAGVAVKDAYEGLKKLIKQKFGDKTDLVDAVDKLEKKPDSEARKATVKEEIETAKIDGDSEILKLAQDLLDKAKGEPGGQEIINQTQTNTVSGVTVGGNFEFKPVQEGKKG